MFSLRCPWAPRLPAGFLIARQDPKTFGFFLGCIHSATSNCKYTRNLRKEERFDFILHHYLSDILYVPTSVEAKCFWSFYIMCKPHDATWCSWLWALRFLIPVDDIPKVGRAGAGDPHDFRRNFWLYAGAYAAHYKQHKDEFPLVAETSTFMGAYGLHCRMVKHKLGLLERPPRDAAGTSAPSGGTQPSAAAAAAP